MGMCKWHILWLAFNNVAMLGTSNAATIGPLDVIWAKGFQAQTLYFSSLILVCRIDRIVISMSENSSKRSRASYIGQITFLEKQYPVSKDPTMDVALCEEVLERLIRIEERLDSTHSKLLSEVPEAKVNEEEIIFSDAMERLQALRIRLRRQRLTVTEVATNENSNYGVATSSSRGSAPQTTLPRLTIPSFEGDPRQWMAFSDMFKSTVLDNNSISEVEKLRHLLSRLEGPAKGLLEDVPITGSELQGAWERLQRRFANPYQICRAHIHSLTSIPIINNVNPFALRSLSDNMDRTIRGLKNLGEKYTSGDPWIVAVVVDRMDPTTRNQWMEQRTDAPDLPQLTAFLAKRCRDLEDASYSTAGTRAAQVNQITKQPSGEFKKKVGYKCYHCNQSHKLMKCPEFLKLSPADRRRRVGDLQLCFNCLSNGHIREKCRDPRSCRVCSQNHHTTLHIDGIQEVRVHMLYSNRCISTLATIQVYLDGGNGIMLRALLDSGSHINLITQRALKNLDKTVCTVREASPIAITTLGNQKQGVQTKEAIFTVVNASGSARMSLRCTPVPCISTIDNVQNVSATFNGAVKEEELADPHWNVGGEIDILIGQPNYLDVIQDGLLQINGCRMGINSVFGWVICGVEPSRACSINTITTEEVRSKQIELEEHMERFWKIEEFPDIVELTPRERQADEHFEKTVRFESGNRFVVTLPIVGDLNTLGNTKELAEKRLLSMERKMEANPSFKERYLEFMNTYIQQGHMEKKSPAEDKIVCWLPHHAILKEESVSTKLRTVFDASAKTNGAPSLNDLQLLGRINQKSILHLLLGFRLYKIALNADIRSMYRCIDLVPEQRNLQYILWRSDPNAPIDSFQLNTLTYGLKTAPQLAVNCLNKLGLIHENLYPNGSKVIKSGFYMDDMLISMNSVEEAINTAQEVVEILNKGQFYLCKFVSNSKDVLERLPSDRLHRSVVDLNLDSDRITTLGVHWNPERDELLFKTNSSNENPGYATKRQILSTVSRIYDPLGILLPVSVQLRILLQDIWKLPGIQWDEPLPAEIKDKYMGLQEQLSEVGKIKIPRHVGYSKDTSIILHGFCDASPKAYGAVVYSVCVEREITRSELILSKAKVCPVKATSVPRLELLAALLLSQLMTHIIDNLDVGNNLTTKCWCDSQVVLSWLRQSPYTLNLFVANRVNRIIERLPGVEWSYIQSKENPADLLSRGISTKTLAASKLWFKGPEWILLPQCQWPKSEIFQPVILESRVLSCFAKEAKFNSQGLADEMLSRYSCWHKMLRIIGYTLRARDKKSSISVTLDADEIDAARKFIITQVQGEYLKPLIATRKYLMLSPFKDVDGLYRANSRIRLAEIPFEARHPIILPPHSSLLERIVVATHNDNMHCGSGTLLAILRQKYFWYHMRKICRRVLQSCVKCMRHSRIRYSPPIAPLPNSRLALCPAFSNCGVDGTGPFSVLSVRCPGKPKHLKIWIFLFCCMSSRAVHLEISLGLSTVDFIQCLRRFMARRGMPNTLFSDRGTNFIGMVSQLAESSGESETSDELDNFLNQRGIKWSLNVPHAPHTGGAWESLIHSFKRYFKKIISVKEFSFDEMETIIVAIEGLLNSRPLRVLRESMEETIILTPAHLLIGRSLSALPTLPLERSVKARWCAVRKAQEEFWRLWSVDYLPELIRGSKWEKNGRTAAVGDVVIVPDITAAPGLWPIGRINKLNVGKDGFARSAEVNIERTTVTRSVRDLIPLQNVDVELRGEIVQ